MLYLIDIVGTCNLRCPSCPVGNMKGSFIGETRKKGFMPFELFQRVVEKASRESAESGQPLNIALYNWGEALMHPEINRFVTYLHEQNITFNISTNLNNEIDYTEIIKSEPELFRVSLSGGLNETYQKNHKGGDINLVISNLYKLRHQIDKSKKLHGTKELPVQVYYHLYKDNCDDDIAIIYDICINLGFYFMPGIAQLMPLEKLIYAAGKMDKFTEQDQQVIDRLFFTVEESSQIAAMNPMRQCVLLENQVVINFDGSVPVCCAVYDPIFTVAPDFLAVPLGMLQEQRRQSSICSICMENHFHAVAVNHNMHFFNFTLQQKQKQLGTKYRTNLQAQPHVEVNN